MVFGTRIIFWCLLAVVTWSLQATSAVAQNSCQRGNPEAAVWDLVKQSDNGTVVGTAFLVDTIRGIFFTAFHNLATGKLELKSGNTSYKFEVLSGGANPTWRHVDDWALLRAKVEDLNKGTYPNPDLQVIYDRPSMSDLAKSEVFSSRGEISNLNGVNWVPDLGPLEACEDGKIAMIEIADYDHGNSGAAVFSRQQCGVVALSSRFVLAKDVSDDVRKEMVEMFHRYTKLIDKAEFQNLDNVAKPMHERYDILRELLKNKVLVKIVPTQCIIDQLVRKALDEDAQNIIVLPRSASTALLTETLVNVDADDWRSTRDLAEQIKNNSWKWIDYLQAINAYRKSVHSGLLKNGRYSYVLDQALLEAAKALGFEHVAGIYNAAGYRLASNTEGHEAGPILASAFKAEFIRNNVGWNANPNNRDFGLSFPPEVAGNLTPEEKLKAGLEVADWIYGPDNSERDPDRRFYSDTAVAYLTSALDGSKSPTVLSDNERAQGAAMIAKLLTDENSPSQFWPLSDTEANVAALSDGLSDVALTFLPENDPLRMTVATVKIANQNVLANHTFAKHFNNRDEIYTTSGEPTAPIPTMQREGSEILDWAGRTDMQMRPLTTP